MQFCFVYKVSGSVAPSGPPPNIVGYPVFTASHAWYGTAKRPLCRGLQAQRHGLRHDDVCLYVCGGTDVVSQAKYVESVVGIFRVLLGVMLLCLLASSERVKLIKPVVSSRQMENTGTLAPTYGRNVPWAMSEQVLLLTLPWRKKKALWNKKNCEWRRRLLL